jgi:NitT/TauT family transport system permease protein
MEGRRAVRSARRTNTMRKGNDARVTLVGVLVFFAVWEALVDLLHVPAYILPGPWSVLVQLVGNFPFMLGYLGVTAYESYGGFVLAILIGVPLSLLIAFSAFMRRTFYPGVVALQLVPKIALAPLFITWFGFGITPKVLITFLVCFFPILLNCILGFLSLSQELTFFSRTTGAGPVRTFLRIRFPAALPQIFVGFRWAAVNATVGATVGEWVGADAGLGYYLQIQTGELHMSLAFAIIVVLALLGLSQYYLVRFLERRLIPWHISQRSTRRTQAF